MIYKECISNISIEASGNMAWRSNRQVKIEQHSPIVIEEFAITYS